MVNVELVLMLALRYAATVDGHLSIVLYVHASMGDVIMMLAALNIRMDGRQRDRCVLGKRTASKRGHLTTCGTCKNGCLVHCCCAMLCSTCTTLPCGQHAALTSQDGSSSGSLNIRRVARNSLTLPSATCS